MFQSWLYQLKIIQNNWTFEQLKSGFKRTINCNKYQPKVTIEKQNQYLDYLMNLRFKEVKKLVFYYLKIMMIEKHAQDTFFQI